MSVIEGSSTEEVSASSEGHSHGAGFWSLTLGSIGVVYGDIGTSPLYAFKQAVLAAAGSRPITSAEVLGVLSLIIWTLVLIVGCKYVTILLRADNKGEGGTLTLMALAQRALGGTTTFIVALGMVGAALFYGDSMLTPAISVLSAVEGLKLVAPHFDAWIVPLTLVILLVLFAAQSRGTAKVAAFFGPVTLVWFLVIAVLGVAKIAQEPSVLAAVNPMLGVTFLIHHGVVGLFVLGAVFLAVTGAEALYADLGHFGRKPIQTAWFGVVFPALVINYMGQGALLLREPETIDNPFFKLAPDWALVPLVILATVATIIASQAVITGAYSLTHQAIQLGLLPRMEIRHTSEAQSGQIFLPRVNAVLLIGVLLLVILFRSSDAMASAYGIAVTGTMVVTAIMAFIVVWKVWRWSPLAAGALIAPLLFIDCVFLFANSLKLFEGGFVPVIIAAGMMAIMITWRRGSRILFDKTRKTEVPLAALIANLEKKPPHTVPGTAVFLTSDPDFTPTALLHSLKHYKVLHEKNVILTVTTASTPRVPDSERVVYTPVSERFAKVHLTFGFAETPNVPRGLALCRKIGWKYDIMSTSFFLSRRSLKIASKSAMPLWQDKLFLMLVRNAGGAAEFFHIPTGRAVELGTQILV
jgi:KUP system potassium uptake protein